MDPTTSSVLFGIFIIGILLFVYLFSGEMRLGNERLLKSAEHPNYDLSSFLQRGDKSISSRKRYSFSEENLVCMTYRYSGRADDLIVRWSSGPLLEAVVERKFPRSHLPDEPVDEDLFQASLYALALKEKGLSVSSTRIINLYCLQDDAEKCLQRGSSSNCVGCKKGVTFSKRFNESRTIKTLDKLDEVWYRDRKPSPKPSNRNCRICPYGMNGICNYSVV